MVQRTPADAGVGDEKIGSQDGSKTQWPRFLAHNRSNRPGRGTRPANCKRQSRFASGSFRPMATGSMRSIFSGSSRLGQAGTISRAITWTPPCA